MIASLWQAVGWIAGIVIVAAVIGALVWRQRRRRAPRARHLTAVPPVPRKPNGEDRRA
jgi:uncharacterized iron-regulated membrane protein